jgi:transcriptional regulator with XRE-family HTH domain
MFKNEMALIGRNIKRLRLERDLTQKQLVQKMGVLKMTEKRLSYIENSKGRIPSLNELAMISRALGIGHEELKKLTENDVCPICEAAYPDYTKKFREIFPMTNQYHKMFHENSSNHDKLRIVKQYAQYLIETAEIKYNS